MRAAAPSVTDETRSGDAEESVPTQPAAKKTEWQSFHVRVDPDGLWQLKILAAERRTTLQGLAIDAMNALLAEAGRPLVKNPRGAVGRPPTKTKTRAGSSKS